MRLTWRSVIVLAVYFLLVPRGFADDATARAAKTDPDTSATVHAASKTAKAARKGKVSAKKNADSAQKKANSKKKSTDGTSTRDPAPVLPPMPATTGTLGLFTVDSGETMPSKSFSASAYVNKFSRMPGSVTVFNLGWNFAYALTDRFTVYVDWDAYRHLHIGAPNQLSLNQIFGPGHTQFDSTIYRTICAGCTPAYVEDYPFANANNGGIGDISVGIQFGILSEKKGNFMSLAVRNDFIIPTVRAQSSLLDNAGQSGEFNDTIMGSMSKTFGRTAMLAFDAGYRFTRDPRAGGMVEMIQADQFRTGAGMLFLPDRRIQPMMEYTGVIFVGNHTPNESFGARDPVDGVWGVRLYPFKSVGLDVGYRYMLNLGNAHDRNGFVVKLGTTYWREKEGPAPVHHPPVASCSADKSSLVAGSGEVVDVRVQGSSPDNLPLTYAWSATGGQVEGTGSEVRWNSAGVNPGSYTVNVRVDDGQGGTASCGVDVRVEPKPHRGPVMSCAVDRGTVLVGERVKVAAQASSPDGEALTYTWRTSGGQIVGSGATVELDTSGLSPGHYTITGRVEDPEGAAADCTTGVDVQAPPPAPQASKINECLFERMDIARVDNACKRILDDVALRLKNEPRGTVVLIGYADPKERRAGALAEKRASNVKDYITAQGVDGSRITVRGAAGQVGGEKENRRVEIIWVPEGATY